MSIGRESEILEFKKSTGELSEGVISIAAMLNKHGSGELYFGVRNDGTVLGQQIGESTLRDVSQVVAAHIDPKIFPTIELVYLDDKPCIYVKFTGDDAPYLAYGRGYIRVADEDKQMPASELEDYILRKNIRKDTWDSETSDKTPADVDDAVLQVYLERANRAERISFTYSTKEDVLNRLDLIENGKLKNAARALYVGWPLLEIQMAIFAGTERLTFNDIQRESGSVTDLIKAAERYIRNNTRWRVVFDGSLQRKEIPEIPMDAIREAIINSYCHRDYRSSQNNEVTIHSDRIEIYNPGTFPEGMTPEDYFKGNIRSIKRNPLLAQLLYYTKDIENFGTGLKRISDECAANNVKVDFQMMKHGFVVVFYRPEISYIDNRFKGKTGDESKRHNSNSINAGQVTEQVERIQNIIEFCEHPRTRKEIQDHIGITSREHFAKAYLNPLLDSGQLIMTVPDKPNSRNQKYVRGQKNG